MAIETRKKITQLIKNKKIRNIAIVMHNNPDGDCIGSAVALEEALKYNNKKVDIILHDKVSSKFSHIIGKNRVEKYILPYEGKRYDLVFMLDVSDFNRTYYDVRNISKNIIIIDHHTNNNIPRVKYYLNEKDASTGMTIYKIIKYICPITPKIATAIYLTIRSDTGSFKNLNTNVKVHETAGKLLMHGADLSLINKIYDDKTLSYLNLLANTLNNIKIDKKHKIAHLIITRNDILKAKSNMKEAGLIIDLIKNLENIDISYIFIENVNQVVIKGRSKKFNISQVFSEIGGGGHKHSAGCIVYSDDIYKTKDRLINLTIDKIDNND